MSAEIIPIDRSDSPLVKEEYTEAIRLWCQTRDTADMLTREEAGHLYRLIFGGEVVEILWKDVFMVQGFHSID